MVFDLIRDQAQRHRFTPEGWRVLRTLTERTDEAGSNMEVEWQLGPRLTTQVIEIYEVTENQVIEGPPPRENYITTWTVGEDKRATLVGIHMRFSYGDWISEWVVKRRLRRALRQQLARLKMVAEGDRTLDGGLIIEKP